MDMDMDNLIKVIYECDNCGKSFKFNSDYIRHINRKNTCDNSKKKKYMLQKGHAHIVIKHLLEQIHSSIIWTNVKTKNLKH